jgi:hypothetical protein
MRRCRDLRLKKKEARTGKVRGTVARRAALRREGRLKKKDSRTGTVRREEHRFKMEDQSRCSSREGAKPRRSTSRLMAASSSGFLGSLLFRVPRGFA